MSRTAWMPDFGASDSLYQPVQVPEPGDPGYPGKLLPETDPCAPAWNRALAEVEADRPDAYLAGSDPEAEAGL